MSNNIPVNGWPQLKDLEAVQPTLDRLDKIEAWKRTVKEETFTGEEITIPNALALPARSLITEINAIQDLHGLPFPYVGGAYKNKLPMTVASIKAANTGGTWSGNIYTYRGIEYTILTDSADNITGINVNGNNTTTSSADLWIPVNQTIDGIFNGCPTGGSSSSYLQTVWSDQGGHVASDTGSGVSVAGIAITSVSIRVRNGVTISNKVFKPMIRLSTESDATFAPYSNECPISGRTAVVVTRSDGDEISEDFTIQLGTTVYGADINWDTGVATVNWRYDTFDGSSDELWAYDSGRGQFYITNSAIDNKAKGLIISDSYKGVQVDQWNELHNGEITTHPTSNNVIRLMTDLYNSLDAFKTAISTAPIHVCYEINTPTTIQLTPAQLEMLKGYNRIALSDGYGTIELKALTGANWS